jgi:ATP adenylyltransferase/5',5'''-P-1,P-4-tetraphosphate phosphorylase II
MTLPERLLIACSDLRKKAELLPTNDVSIGFQVLADLDNIDFEEVFKAQGQTI